MFVDKITGIYLVQFNGVGYCTPEDYTCSVFLRVNDVFKDGSLCKETDSGMTCNGSLCISADIKLNSRNRVDVFVVNCSQYKGDDSINCFSAILLAY